MKKTNPGEKKWEISVYKN